jgi:hypothetical protein
MEQSGNSNLSPEWTEFLKSLSFITDDEKDFEGHVWNRVHELECFASRVINPNDNLMSEMKGVRDKILENPNSYRNPEKLAELLEPIEEQNKGIFREKNSEDIA